MIDNGPRSTGINLLTSPDALRRTSIFGGGVFVSKSLLGIKEQKPRGHVRILRYRTWSIIDESRLHLAFPPEKYRNQRFGHFGNGDKWDRYFLGKGPETLEIVEFSEKRIIEPKILEIPE